MKYLEINGRDNLEETALAVRPNHIIALKPAGDHTKILVTNFPHWILVDREFEDLLKELKSTSLRKKKSDNISV